MVADQLLLDSADRFLCQQKVQERMGVPKMGFVSVPGELDGVTIPTGSNRIHRFGLEREHTSIFPLPNKLDS